MGTRFISAIGTGLSRLGIWTQLFIVVREGIQPVAVPDPDPTLTFGWLSREDIDPVHALEPWRKRSQVKSWFEPGQCVFGVKAGERLVGRTVCNLENFDMNGLLRPLEPDEVYLHSACVDPAYRNRNIATRLRGSCYEALRQRGCQRFYSVTKYLNTPARRFKQKLGAAEESLLLYIGLFNRWSWTFSWKKAAAPATKKAARRMAGRRKDKG